MNTFYCVTAIFNISGIVKSYITKRQAKKQPLCQFKEIEDLSVFKIWWVSKAVAENILECIKSGETDLSGMRYLFSELPDCRKEFAF